MKHRERYDHEGIPLRFWSARTSLDSMRARMANITYWLVTRRGPDWLSREPLLRRRYEQLATAFMGRAYCAYCGEWIGDFHQCPGTLAEDADAAAMRAYTLEQREHATNRGL